MDGNRLGKVLEDIRKSKKLTLRDVAVKTGLSHTYIRDLELNYNRKTKAPIKPTPDTLRKLSQAYDYPYEQLLKLAGFFPSEDDPIQAIIDDPNSSETKKRFAQLIKELPDEKLEALLTLLDSVSMPK